MTKDVLKKHKGKSSKRVQVVQLVQIRAQVFETSLV